MSQRVFESLRRQDSTASSRSGRVGTKFSGSLIGGRQCYVDVRQASPCWGGPAIIGGSVEPAGKRKEIAAKAALILLPGFESGDVPFFQVGRCR